MYRCQICNTVSPAATPSHKVTLESRPKEYPSRPKACSMRVGRKLKSFDDPGGSGYEIAKEVMACRSCAEEHAKAQAEAAEASVASF